MSERRRNVNSPTQRREATAQVIHEVQQERAAQDRQWGEQNHHDGTGDQRHLLRKVNQPTYGTLCYLQRDATQDHAQAGSVTFADILLEEVFEAVASDDTDNLREELIQVAAVAVAWVEAIDRRSESHE